MLLRLDEPIKSLSSGGPVLFKKIVAGKEVTAAMTVRDAILQVLEMDSGPERGPMGAGGASRVDAWRLAVVIADAPAEFEFEDDRVTTLRAVLHRSEFRAGVVGQIEALLDDGWREKKPAEGDAAAQ